MSVFNPSHLVSAISHKILAASPDKFENCNFLQPYDKVVVGAAALRYDPRLGPKRIPHILLLKRVACEKYFPSVFELPSGKVDEKDLSIRHALIREVHEETGLKVTNILAELKPMIYTTHKRVVDNTGRDVHVAKSAIQLNYVVSLSNGDVRLSVDEHSESIWATEEELRRLNVTSAMRIVIQEAFTWAASNCL